MLQGIFDGRGVFNGTKVHQSNHSWDSHSVFYLDDKLLKKLLFEQMIKRLGQFSWDLEYGITGRLQGARCLDETELNSTSVV